MNIQKFRKGSVVKNLYGKKLTVSEVINDTMVRAYEEPNDLYHHTKLIAN
jgi:hypothetical protein